MYNLGGDLMRQQASLKPKVILKHNIALNQKCLNNYEYFRLTTMN